ARATLGRSATFGYRREHLPRQVAHLPLLFLRELVEAKDAGVRLAAELGFLHQLLCRHLRELIRVAWRRNSFAPPPPRTGDSITRSTRQPHASNPRCARRTASRCSARR